MYLLNFVFSCFLKVFATFDQKSKQPKKNKNKQDCKTHVGTSWWVRVCNFVLYVFFGFLEVFATFGQKPKKHRENQKKQKNKIARPM